MELITAVGLFAVFSLVVLVGINPLAQYNKAQDSKRKNDLAQLARGIELYYGDHGQYPRESNGYIANESGQAIPWGNEWQPYVDLLPEDPRDIKRYRYEVSPDRQSFWIYASLDVKSDPARCNREPQSACNMVDISGGCATSGQNPQPDYPYSCDYGLSSPNAHPNYDPNY